MKKSTVQPVMAIKAVVALIVALIALYAFVYVPSQQLMFAQQAADRAEARVHNSCVLLAEQATQQTIANQPEDAEEPTNEQINQFLNTQYVQCIASEGYDPQALAAKYIQPNQAESVLQQ